MFGNLFDDDKPAGVMSGVHKLNISVPCPPLPRHPCGFSGIANQGATCYLNSLLQTLLFTPEFREGLFKLSDHELGSIEDREKGGKVRIIPLQLQRLFTRLLLVDQQAASTSELTDSFGWSNKEGLQQHDVQELNRILFSAIESSLVGTSGSELISKLYHGSTVNEIVCQMCGKISEKEEDFLDLNVVVANFNSLQDSLNATFLQKETMKGKNQYRCSTCCNLVDAKKGLKIRCLPPILTLSLSRFSYDIAIGERYKETRRFVFPMEIDMSSYCDKQLSTEDSLYELFSVVIHSGSSYGGHYHVFIRDVDCLGKWFNPAEEPLVIPSCDSNNWDAIDGPMELIKTLLSQQEDLCLPVDVLCWEISKCTGFSWNKRFKRSHGPINKFLQKHTDVFYLNPATGVVYLKGNPSSTEHLSDNLCMENNTATITESSHGSPKEAKKSVKPSLKLNFFDKKKIHNLTSDLDQHWFDFNDSCVSPICLKDIEKQYSGKESAYMLFYRRKSLARPEEAKNNPCYVMPKRLVELAEAENAELNSQREQYEAVLNTITIHLHSSNNYSYQRGALQPKDETVKAVEVMIDKRKSLSDLRQIIHNMYFEASTPVAEPDLHLYVSQDLPAGLHLSKELCPSQDCESLIDVGVLEGTKIFVCHGSKVGDQDVIVGAAFEPVLLHISAMQPTGEITEISRGFPKFITISELKVDLCKLLSLEMEDVILNKMDLQGDKSCILKIEENQLNNSLSELNFVDGDSLVLESLSYMKGNVTSEEGAQNLVVVLYNNSLGSSNGESLECQMTEVNVEHESTVADVKARAISKFSIDTSKQYVLRKYLENRSKGPPLHDSQSFKSGELAEVKYVLIEEGRPPSDEEITLKFSVKGIAGDLHCLEINIDKKSTIQQCLKIVLNSLGIKGDSWHLQKTNWCGEPMEILFLETATLEDENIRHGDFLFITTGHIPPKGFMSFTIWLYPTFENLQRSPSPLNGILNDYERLYRSLFSMVENECGLVKLGEVELSGDSTLADLKKYILTLPMLSTVSLPSVRFLRLRLIDGNKPGKVLRCLTNSLRKLKLQSHQSLCIQLLPCEEDLAQHELLLNISQQIPNTRMYMPPSEMIWDTAKSPSPKALKQAISECLSIPVHRLVIAKHFSDKFQWLVIEENYNQKKSNRNRWSSKKMNLRYSPYFLRDGDTIGIKDQRMDTNDLDDFNTQEDIEGQEILRIAAEGKRQRRQTRNSSGCGDWMLGGSDSESSRFLKKSEIGITIHVDDFR